MSSVSTVAVSSASSSSASDCAREGEPLQKAIQQKMGLEPGDSLATSIEEQLVGRYPEISLGVELGRGTFSTAYLFTYKRPDGTEGKKVIKMSQFRNAVEGKDSEKSNHLNRLRMGGEWMAPLNFGENVVKTELAIAYDIVNQKIIFIPAEEVQKMFSNSEMREGKSWALFGTVSEFIEGSSSLAEALERYDKPLPVEAIRSYARQILNGVASIHRMKPEGGDELTLIHRDIKPENMLLVSEGEESIGAGQIKILDFGFSRLVEESGRRYTTLGTPAFLAPEILDKDGGSNQKQLDAYATAATLSLMATKMFPYQGNVRGLINALIDRDVEILGNHMDTHADVVDPELSDLIRGMGAINPAERMTVEGALEHPFFTSHPEPVGVVEPLPTIPEPVAAEEGVLAASGSIGEGSVLLAPSSTLPSKPVDERRRMCLIQ